MYLERAVSDTSSSHLIRSIDRRAVAANKFAYIFSLVISGQSQNCNQDAHSSMRKVAF